MNGDLVNYAKSKVDMCSTSDWLKTCEKRSYCFTVWLYCNAV